MARVLKTYFLDSTFDFGKYSGNTIQETILKDEEYIQWCILNVDWFCISEDCFSKFFLLQLGEVLPVFKNKAEHLQKINSSKISQCASKFSRINEYQPSYENDDYYSDYNSDNWLIDAAGSDDPEVMNDVYWNLD